MPVIERVTEQILLKVTHEQTARVCEILGLDPSECVSLAIHAGVPENAGVATVLIR
jgi:hypothetical protein